MTSDNDPKLHSGPSSHMIKWECGASVFNWHYDRDEYVYIIEGLVYATKLGVFDSVRLTPGSTHLFKAGETWKWEVYEPVKKIAVLVEPVPRWLGFIMKLSRKLRLRK